MFAFNERAKLGFDEYTGIFDNFIESYRQNLMELQELSLQMVNILDSAQFMSSNNAILSSYSSLSGTSSSSVWYDPDVDYLGQALSYASSGDLDGAMDALERRNQKVQDQGNDRGTSSSEAYNKVMQAYNSSLKGYAEGIENGPVTETGPVMLHGTESSPEYVLNSDQVYNLLRNQALEENDNSNYKTSNGINVNNTGTNVSNQVNNSIDGLNKIITQISSLINQESLTTSQLVQSVVIQQKVIELLNSLYAIKNQESELLDQNFGQIIENTNNLIEILNSNFDQLKESFANNNETLSSILDNIQKGLDCLSNLVSILQGGFSGYWSINGSFSGNFNGGGSSNSSSNATANGGAGENGEFTYDRPYGSGWNYGIDYLQEAIDAAKEGKTDEAFENLLKRGYKVQDTGDNKGTTQQEAIDLITSLLQEGGYNTIPSLGTSGIYTGDSYSNNSSNNLSSSSSSSGSSKPNYGGYDNRDDFNNAIQDAFDKSESTGDKVYIGNSGLYIDTSKTKSYSTGIENGPITYTGLAMLHGSKNNPEYVLNSDQAYNLLKNMSTLKMADFDTNNNSGNGISYIVEGDIVLQDVNNPAEFWKKVTSTMETRWNVTKNKKY